MTIFDSIRALAEAHNERDEERFRVSLLQIAAHAKSETVRDTLQRLAKAPKAMMAIPIPSSSDLAVPIRPPEDLVLAQPIRALLQEIAEEHAALQELAARHLRPRQRLLFYGAPGNGKTSAAAVLAASLKREGFVVSLPSLVGAHMGDTAKNLARLFGILHAGAVLVFDEVDAVADARTADASGAGRERNSTVAALLTLMDRQEHGILVATTNRPELLDAAVRRRFDAEVEFKAPGWAEVNELLVALAKRHGPIQTTREQLGALIDMSRESFDAWTKAYREHARREAIAASKTRRAPGLFLGGITT